MRFSYNWSVVFDFNSSTPKLVFAYAVLDYIIRSARKALNHNKECTVLSLSDVQPETVAPAEGEAAR